MHTFNQTLENAMGGGFEMQDQLDQVAEAKLESIAQIAAILVVANNAPRSSAVEQANMTFLEMETAERDQTGVHATLAEAQPPALPKDINLINRIAAIKNEILIQIQEGVYDIV